MQDSVLLTMMQPQTLIFQNNVSEIAKWEKCTGIVKEKQTGRKAVRLTHRYTDRYRLCVMRCSNIHSNTRAGRNRQVSLESKPKPLHWTYYRHLSLRTAKQPCTHICLLLQCSAAQVSVTVWRSVNEVLKENTFLYKALEKAANHAFIIINKRAEAIRSHFLKAFTFLPHS